MKIMIAIPCLNEENNIGRVIESILSVNIFSKVECDDDIKQLEILIVDDGSSDNTVEAAKKLWHGNAENESLTIISHVGNKGLGIAFQTALNYAANNNVDIMVNMDGDGQFNAENIPNLISPIISNNADVVMGSRFVNSGRTENMPLIKYWGNIMMSKIISHLCRQKFYDVSCGFRAYSKETILKSNFHGKYTYTQEAFIFYTTQNLKIVEAPIDVQYFKGRKSRVAGNILKYAFKTLGIILSLYRDYYPMRLFGMIASASTIISVGFGIVFFNHYLRTGHFTGYLFAGLISGFFMAISILFFMCGIILQGNVRTRDNQNRILYLMKKNNFK